MQNSKNKQIAMIDEMRKQRDSVDFSASSLSGSLFSGFGEPAMILEDAEDALSEEEEVK
jgi:hypothetical protein